MTSKSVLKEMLKEQKLLRARKKKFTTTAIKVKKEQSIDTIVDDELESTKIAKIGDWIVSGTKGERYPISDKKLKEKYYIGTLIGTKKEGEEFEVTTKQVEILCKESTIDCEFEANWGEKMLLKKGDYIVYENNLPSYRIERGAFYNTYNLLTDDGELVFTVVKDGK